MLPPTSPDLLRGETRLYFLWWTDLTVDGFRQQLQDAELRPYWMGALLREANSRDVWLFVTPAEVRETWPRLQRYLGKSLRMWGWILDMPVSWPPRV
ncbi:MAG TPA: hypothetical protein VGO93_15970 [Candidatus Xenobia bacterium]|jgi:hypothetical protein